MKVKAIERILMILCSLACVADGIIGIITLGTPKLGLNLKSATILAKYRHEHDLFPKRTQPEEA